MKNFNSRLILSGVWGIEKKIKYDPKFLFKCGIRDWILTRRQFVLQILLKFSKLTIFTNRVRTQDVKRQSFWFAFRRASAILMHGVSAISKQILITVSNSFPAWRSSSWALQDSIQHSLKVDGHTNGHNVKCSSTFYT